MSDTGLKPRSFRQVVVPRPISLSGIDEQQEVLVIIGMPVVIDSVEAQLFAPASLRNSPSNRSWFSSGSRAVVKVQLYHPPNTLVFGFEIPTSFRQRKRYLPPLSTIDVYDNELPLLARATQHFSPDPSHALPEEVRVDLVVHLIPDFYEG